MYIAFFVCKNVEIGQRHRSKNITFLHHTA